MLFGVYSSKPIAYRVHDSPHPLFPSNGQGHVLSSNSFAVGHLHYTLEFADFTKERYISFVEQRNTILEPYGFSNPHAGLSVIHRHQDTKRGPVITHGTLSTGKFGMVYAAVIASSGEPLAVKQHRANTQRDLRLIRREADIGTQFEVWDSTIGIVTTDVRIAAARSAARPIPVVRTPICWRVQSSASSSFYSLAPRPLGFPGMLWGDQNLSSIRDCFQGPVQGLATLHAAGYIHRDVHTRNLFLMRSEPPEAVLGDFGKTIEAESASDNCLGPIHTRAPEVDGRTQYTNKIAI